MGPVKSVGSIRPEGPVRPTMLCLLNFCVFSGLFIEINQCLSNVVKKATGLQDHSKYFTLYFPDRPVQSDTISASLGSIQPYATINARRLLVHISTSVYSQVLIYTAE